MGTDDRPVAGFNADTQELIGGRYRLVRKIGSGGMATVWLAEDDRLDRRVAIKRLHTAAPEDAAKRLVREARLGAGLSDPHLVTIYDAIPADDGVLIVMELVEGADLDQELRAGPLDQARALHVLGAIAQALDHAHERGVVHRDVKPSNVLLGRADTVKLTDLGIAKAMEDTGFTQSGMILGSVPYMSPEQLLGESVGTASDIYSLGLIAYECLSGVRGRQETGAPQAAHAASHGSPPDIRRDRPQSSAAVAAVVRGALDRDPTRRPGSAGAFVRDLAAGLDAEAGAGVASATAGATATGRALPPGRAGRREGLWRSGSERFRSRLAALGALALIGGLIALAISQAGGGDTAGQRPASGKSATSRESGSASAGGPGNASGGGQGSPAADAATVTAAASSSAPAKAVQDFYELAASGDTRSAWGLAAPSFRDQLGGYAAFESQQSTLRRIKFRSLEKTTQSGNSASVAFATTATHSDRVDRCQGSADLVAVDSGWQIAELTSVNCQPG